MRKALVRLVQIVTALIAVLLTAGCDAAADRIPLPDSTAPSGSATAVTTPSITPVTPDGLVTGPGVTEEAITLGVLVDRPDDRGFVAGLQLWQQAVNTSGGLCGRLIQLATSGAAGVPADAVQAYEAIGRSVLGLVIVRSPDGSADLTSRIATDQLPTLTPTGTSNVLGPTLPVVMGATADVLAINGLDHLERTDQVRTGGTVGVLTDGSPTAENALTGARWWAADRGVTLDVRTAGPGTDTGSWGSATVVLSLADAATTGEVAASTSADVTVLTTTDGYDPTAWSAPALAAAETGRVLVTMTTPAYGSDYPAAAGVAARAAAAGVSDQQPRLLEGYATGVSWDRLLTQACTDRSLTRPAVEQAMVTVGPASVDSLFGPTDPARVVQSGLPATLLSAVSTAKPSVTGGLVPLTWPEAASGIEDYQP